MPRKVSRIYNLAVIYPTLAREWHPTKNKSKTAKDVTPYSHHKAFWLCKKGHQWEARVDSRSSGSGCPYCSDRTGLSLLALNPTLAKEWHPTKNKSLTPVDIAPYAGKKVWWLCKRGHEWQAKVENRSHGEGCPFCHSCSSKAELRIYTEIKSIFKNVQHRRKVYGAECDIFVPALKVAIEVDGLYWHKNKYRADKQKTDLLNDKGIVLIRLREKGLRKISRKDIVFSQTNFDFNLMKKIVNSILKITISNTRLKAEIKKYLKNKTFVNENEFNKLLFMLPSPLPGYALADVNRRLVQEWHPTKNLPLSPKDVFPFAHLKAWWLCKHGHEWKANVSDRGRGNNCPYCSGKVVCKDNCLLTVNSILAKEWHPTKNGVLTPEKVTGSSSEEVWWQCAMGHEWMARVADRNAGNGCPYCSGRKASRENCLLTINPKLAKEWNFVKNRRLTPRNVTPYAHLKAWWRCKRDHEWRETVANRSHGNNCPFCSGKRACKDNCLFIINPALAREWHPKKNKNLSPKNVTPHSNKKVWWRCKKGHEWEAVINSRSAGRGCPYCSGRKASKENCLLTINPKLAKEWHPTKNKPLTPRKVVLHSHNKVWWLCRKGHEWQATIDKRSMGRGCPYCGHRKKFTRTAMKV
jgi:hypothetical protein